MVQNELINPLLLPPRHRRALQQTHGHFGRSDTVDHLLAILVDRLHQVRAFGAANKAFDVVAPSLKYQCQFRVNVAIFGHFRRPCRDFFEMASVREFGILVGRVDVREGEGNHAT